jgi:3-oxoacyl-[acyl-carrier-protein] synthase-3
MLIPLDIDLIIMGTATPDMPVAGLSAATAIELRTLLLLICRQLVPVFCMECLLPQHVQSGKYKKVLLIELIKCLLS